MSPTQRSPTLRSAAGHRRRNPGAVGPGVSVTVRTTPGPRRTSAAGYPPYVRTYEGCWDAGRGARVQSNARFLCEVRHVSQGNRCVAPDVLSDSAPARRPAGRGICPRCRRHAPGVASGAGSRCTGCELTAPQIARCSGIVRGHPSPPRTTSARASLAAHEEVRGPHERPARSAASHGKRGDGPMAELKELESEGHCRCCSKRSRPKQAVRWTVRVIYVVYKIVDCWPF